MKNDRERDQAWKEWVANEARRKEQDTEEGRIRREQEVEEWRKSSVSKLARRFWALRRRAYTINEHAVTISPSYVTTALLYLFILSTGVWAGLFFLKGLINGELSGFASIFFIFWVIYWSYKGITKVGTIVSDAQSNRVVHIDSVSRTITRRPWIGKKRSRQLEIIPFRDVVGAEVSYESRNIGEQAQLVWKLSLRLHSGKAIELGQAGGTWHKKHSLPHSPKVPRPIKELSVKITALTGTPYLVEPRDGWWREERSNTGTVS